MPYDVCCDIIILQLHLRGGAGILVATLEATTRPTISNIMLVFGTMLTCLDSYNHALAGIDGQIQKIKVGIFAMFLV
jgi:hypothetical protein